MEFSAQAVAHHVQSMPHLVFHLLIVLHTLQSSVHLHQIRSVVWVPFYASIKFNFTTLWRTAKSSLNRTLHSGVFVLKRRLTPPSPAARLKALPFRLQIQTEIVNCSWEVVHVQTIRHLAPSTSKEVKLHLNEATPKAKNFMPSRIAKNQ